MAGTYVLTYVQTLKGGRTMDQVNVEELNTKKTHTHTPCNDKTCNLTFNV